MMGQLLRNSSLVLPPLVWAVSLQMGEIMPYADCGRGSSLTGWIAFAAATFAALGCCMLWLVRTRSLNTNARFVDHVGLITGPVFTFALLMQGAAALLIDPCAH